MIRNTTVLYVEQRNSFKFSTQFRRNLCLFSLLTTTLLSRLLSQISLLTTTAMEIGSSMVMEVESQPEVDLHWWRMEIQHLQREVGHGSTSKAMEAIEVANMEVNLHNPTAVARGNQKVPI